jgi:hypothetical protein
MCLGSLLHREAALATKVKSARSKERNGLTEGLGCTVGRWHEEDDVQVRGVFISEGHHRRHA